LLTAHGCDPVPLARQVATELVKSNPGYLAEAWLGHSGKVADEFYRTITDNDYLERTILSVAVS
jgi:hypothetical protein